MYKIGEMTTALSQKGKSATNLSDLVKLVPNFDPGLFIYVRPVGRLENYIWYARPVGSPENTSNIGENPNIAFALPPRPSP